MFIKARLKLTAWYLLIIMSVSLSFSAVIYRASLFELRRFAQAQQNRFERMIMQYPPIIDEELFIEARGRILNSLIFINLTILGMSGILGYYLSGKTLAPIQEMMDEQYRFVSDASHELMTPITAIKTTLEVAIRDKEIKIDEAKETLLISLGEVNRLQKLAEGLLEMTQGKVVGTLVPTNLAEVVGQAVKMIKPMAKKKKITIKNNIDKVMVMIDELSMTRAIGAMLDNAVKYSLDKSDVVITQKVGKRNIKIHIADHGAGIRGKDIPRIFDRFYRTDPARSERGYGLGLAIAKRIIEDHGGKIEITSVLNKGTTVSVELPYSARLQEAVIS